jgi:hypothetical protein
VLEALSDAAVDDARRAAMVETEALTATHPPLDCGQWLRTFERSAGCTAGWDRVCCSRRRRWRATPTCGRCWMPRGADEPVVVRLEAEAETLALVAREPKGVVGSMSLSRCPRV